MKRNRIKNYLYIVLLVISLILSGCSYNNALSADDIKKLSIENSMAEYTTPYTLCYKNNDKTYSLYIFSSPILKKDGNKFVRFNDRLSKSSDPDYLFECRNENVCVYLPKEADGVFKIVKGNLSMSFRLKINSDEFGFGKKIVYISAYGESVDAVEYVGTDRKLFFYANETGIQYEVWSKNADRLCVDFDFQSDDLHCKQVNRQYVLVKTNDMQSIIGLFHQPFAVDGNGYFDINTNISLYNNNEIRCSCDNKDVCKIVSSVALVGSNMPDSTIYSKKRENNYLSSFCMLGNTSVLGDSKHYIRTRFRYISPEITSSMIIAASYNTYILSKPHHNNYISVYEPIEQWSSTRLVWKDEESKDNKISGTYVKSHEISFDITEFAKECFDDSDWLLESKGFFLSSQKGELITTSDNRVKIPYIKLILNHLPKSINHLNSINPN